MANAFRVSVVSQDRSLYEGMVQQIAVTAASGELGILAGHTPLMASLKPGQVRLTLESGAEEVIYISGGFLEVQAQQTIILADSAERAAELDEAKVRAAKERAEARMHGLQANDEDGKHLHTELAQLTAQLSAIRRSRR